MSDVLSGSLGVRQADGAECLTHIEHLNKDKNRLVKNGERFGNRYRNDQGVSLAKLSSDSDNVGLPEADSK